MGLVNRPANDNILCDNCKFLEYDFCNLDGYCNCEDSKLYNCCVISDFKVNNEVLNNDCRNFIKK